VIIYTISTPNDLQLPMWVLILIGYSMFPSGPTGRQAT
jgi:hypothetical protein